MTPLAVLRQAMKRFCLHSPDKRANIWEKRAHIVFTFIFIVLLIIAFFQSFVFGLNNANMDLEQSLFAFCIALVPLCMLFIGGIF